MEISDTQGNARHLAYACSYVPLEIILAAGLTPRRLVPEPRPSESHAYTHPNMCGYIRSLLASALAGDFSETAGTVLVNSCDGMRRLCDLWRDYVDAPPVLFIDVPTKKDPDSVEFYAAELNRFAATLEELIGVRITEERLWEAIGACNEVRRLMDEVFALQKEPGSSVSGLAVFDLCMKGGEAPPAAFASEIEQFLSESRGQGAAGSGPGIVLTGNVLHTPDLVALIEAAGGRVAALDTCIGTRHYDHPVDPSMPNPIRAIAERYLSKSPCARMAEAEERHRRIESLAREAGAVGIVHTTTKFCDAFTVELPMLSDRLQGAGYPLLSLENDYDPGGLEGTRTRVEAFLEMIGGGGCHGHV